MAKVIAVQNVTLDGVMQAPGRPDEDTRGGFTHGGWAAPYGAMAQAGAAMANMGAFLFGKRTYEDFYSVWPKRTESPFSAILTNTPKYVASTTLKEPLPWANSTLLKGDAADAIGKLKKDALRDFIIFGSGVLVQSLMKRNQIDEFVLCIHPLVFGTGRRLFPDGGANAALLLVSSKTTESGVVIATYQPSP